MREIFSWAVVIPSVITLTLGSFAVLTLPKRPEYRIAQALFVVAAVYFWVAMVFWGINTSYGVRVRALVIVATVSVSAWLLIEGVRLVENRKRDEDTPAPLVQPQVFTRLVIDAVTSKKVSYHLQIENGPLPIKNIRVVSNTEKFAYAENQTLPRMVPPNKEIRISGLPAVLEPRQYTNLTVRVAFTAEIDGIDKDFVARFRYLVGPDDLKAQIIDPEFSETKEGRLDPQEQDAVVDLAQQFSKPEGTIFIALPETREGKPNIVGHQNDQRRFLYDPVSRKVSFETRTKSGRLVKLEQPMPALKESAHRVLISWNSTGGILGVDGVEVKDIKKEPKD